MPEKKETKRVSTKNVLYVDIDDEITNVFDKIKKISEDDIYLVIPKRSQILQSVVNLKILKKKTSDLKKNISLITTDKTGVNLAYQCGISVFDKIDYGKENNFLKPQDYKQKITPLSAAENVVTQDKPKRLIKKKISISDIIKKESKSPVKFITNFFKARKKDKTDKPHVVLITQNKQALITLIVVSVLVFLLISYIALPSATVILTPEASVLEKKVNITLADNQKYRNELETHPPHMIASYKLQTTAKTTFTYYTASKVTKTKPAEGVIKVFNTSDKKWDLMANTRFQNTEGLVFRTKELVSIPPGSSETPGILEVNVIADEIDSNNIPMGERGNIKPTKFFLPALRESSREKLWGESFEDMSGGSTESLLEITEQDINTAKEMAKKEITKASKQDLFAEVEKLNQEKNSSLSLFNSDKAIKIGDPSIIIPEDIITKNLDKFDVYIESDVTGVAFNKNDLANILKSELQLSKSPQKKILSIYDDDITYEVLEVLDNFSKIKLTATIKGLEIYEINPEKDGAEALIKKIKEHIIGKDVKEAEDYIQNLSEIDKVEIKSWPVWSPTIPSLPENIDIEIREITD